MLEKNQNVVESLDKVEEAKLNLNFKWATNKLLASIFQILPGTFAQDNKEFW